jgi:hypothetical protein
MFQRVAMMSHLSLAFMVVLMAMMNNGKLTER